MNNSKYAKYYEKLNNSKCYKMLTNSKYYKILGLAVIVFGILASIICSIKLGKISIGYYSVRNGGLTITLFLSGTITSALLGSILIGIGTVMEFMEGLRDGSADSCESIQSNEVDAKEA